MSSWFPGMPTSPKSKPQKKHIALNRKLSAVSVPEGRVTQLSKGMQVTVKQHLGGDYTVATEHGYLYRIAGEDADALGFEPLRQDANAGSKELSNETVYEKLSTVFDPEIPVNIVELGLIYSAELKPHDSGQGQMVLITMTLTAPGCGMGPVIVEDVRRKVAQLRGVTEVAVDLVFDPPWDPNRMSEAARLQMGMM